MAGTISFLLVIAVWRITRVTKLKCRYILQTKCSCSFFTFCDLCDSGTTAATMNQNWTSALGSLYLRSHCLYSACAQTWPKWLTFGGAASCHVEFQSLIASTVSFLLVIAVWRITRVTKSKSCNIWQAKCSCSLFTLCDICDPGTTVATSNKNWTCKMTKSKTYLPIKV